MVKEKKSAFGGKLRELREAALYTQQELANAAGINREYVGSMETGRIDVVYPDVFNAVCRALHHRSVNFAGWELLEGMGYRTDGSKGHIYPPLQRMIEELDEDQQRSIAELLRSITRAQDALVQDGRRTG